jgi:hypothetical protein
MTSRRRRNDGPSFSPTQAHHMSRALPTQREYAGLSSMGATQMSKLYVIVTVTTVAANAYAANTDLLRPEWVLDNMAEIGVPRP